MKATKQRTARRSSRQSVGPIVATLLSERPLTQAQVAQSAGMSPAQISNFLNGHADIHASTFVEILSALGIDLMKLIRMEAGIKPSEFGNLAHRLQLLPVVEKNTLLDFFKEYQKRAAKDSYGSVKQDHQIA